MFIKTKYEIVLKQCENVKRFSCHDRPTENDNLNLQVPWALLSFIVTFSPLLAVSPPKELFVFTLSPLEAVCHEEALRMLSSRQTQFTPGR